MKMVEIQDKNGKVYVVKESKAKKQSNHDTETGMVQPPENAMKEKPKPKALGGGWYLTADGRKVRKSELESG